MPKKAPVGNNNEKRCEMLTCKMLIVHVWIAKDQHRWNETAWQMKTFHEKDKFHFFSHQKIGDKIVPCGCSDIPPSGYYNPRPYSEWISSPLNQKLVRPGYSLLPTVFYNWKNWSKDGGPCLQPESSAEWKHRRFWHPVFPLATLLPWCSREEGTLLMLWLGHWVGLIGEHLPNCSCLCSLCFIVLLYFHHSVSRGYFASSGILSLLLCGFLTNPCFKIPCRTLNRNETWWRTADSSLIPRLVWVAAHSGFSAFPQLLNPVLMSTCADFALTDMCSVWRHFWLL